MFTKKSLIVGLALLLSVVCAGSVGAFASSVTPTTPHNAVNLFAPTGAAAIPSNNGDGILKLATVLQYIKTQGFVGGPTANGQPPIVQALKLTSLANLKKLANLVIPGIQGNRQVYYTQIRGPFIMNQNLPLPILGTLLPSANNLPVLSNLPILTQLPGLTSLPLLNAAQNNSGLLRNLPVLGNVQNGGLLNGLSFGYNGSPANGQKDSGLLAMVYEVFDAQSGNLLAWG